MAQLIFIGSARQFAWASLKPSDEHPVLCGIAVRVRDNLAHPMTPPAFVVGVLARVFALKVPPVTRLADAGPEPMRG